MEKCSKTSRIIDIYTRLCACEIIQKDVEARRFQVDTRSIQRDIDDIRAYLADRTVLNGDSQKIVYDRRKRGFLLDGSSSQTMSNSEILAVSKILLDSRAFSEEEMTSILGKIISGCVPYQNMKLVSELLSNEKFHYIEVTHPIGVPEILWELGCNVSSHHLMEITYQRQDASQPAVERTIAPVGIQFSEYYFYLHAYIFQLDEAGTFRPQYDYPAIFRVDRILSYRERTEKFTIPYAGRFQEGEFRKRTQFMYAGKLQHVRLRYSGTNVDAVLDRLPTAVLLSNDHGNWILEAEVYGKGILMWLLSQGTEIEILSPPELRCELVKKLRQMLNKYID